MRVLILIACLLHVACAAPQFVTFKDGKIGVNFGGYHASAGLGGFLTGNAAHGGLSADAGTPWGPKAAAGLGGGIDGRTAGVAYAGAEANPAVGASAVIGGSVNEGGFLGSEAHANGKISSSSLSTNADRMYGDAPAPTVHTPENTNSIQKIKPPKKYSLIKRDQHVSSTSHKRRNSEIAYKTQTSVANARTVVATTTGPAATAAAATLGQSDDNTWTKTTVRATPKPPQTIKTITPADSTNDQNNGQGNGGGGSSFMIVKQRQRHHQGKRLTRPRQRKQHQAQRLKIIEFEEAEIEAPQTVALSLQPDVVHSKQLVKSVHKSVAAPLQPAEATGGEANFHVNSGGLVGNVLNIPIGILRSLQDSLTGLQVDKSVAFTHTG